MQKKRCPASPGLIQPDEQLAYGIYSPEILDPETRKLTSEAISIEKLQGKKRVHEDCCGHSSGLSVARVSLDRGRSELRQRIDDIAKRPGKGGVARRNEGFAIITAADIVEIEGNSLIVLDDGCDCFRSHAVIRGVSACSRSALRGPRDQLIVRLNKTIQRFDDA